MKCTFGICESQVLDFFDFEVGAIAVEHYLKQLQKRWAHIDKLYSDKAYLQTCLARHLYHEGKLDDSGLLRVWAEIDEELTDYDERPTTLCRVELITELRNTVRRFRFAARADRKHPEEVRRVA